MAYRNLHLKFFSILITLVFVTNCSVRNYYSRQLLADDFANDNGFKKKVASTRVKYFDDKVINIIYFEKNITPGKPYNIYIEGDGLAFVNGYPSDNPTPNELMMFKLAAYDSRPNVIYLARPCQYLNLQENSYCQQSLWTYKRFAPEVIDIYENIIPLIAKNHDVNLIGFSGGGAVAILLAARGNKNLRISSIATLAGNLDIVAFNKHHNVLQMPESLNPIDYTAQVKHIPQIHFAAMQDKIVPPFIAQSFVSKAASPKVKFQLTENASHNIGWFELWPQILEELKNLR